MIADIVIIVIMGVCVFLGYARGLIKASVRILSFVASLVIALILYVPISNCIINNTQIVGNIKAVIQEKMNNEDENQGTNNQTNNILDEYIEKYAGEMKENTSEYISQEAAVAIVRVRNVDRIIFSI